MDMVKIGAGMLGWKTHYGVSIEQFPSYDQRKPKPTISVRTSLEILYGSSSVGEIVKGPTDKVLPGASGGAESTNDRFLERK